MMKQSEVAMVAFRVGEITSLLWQLDLDALEYLIKNHDEDFRYAGVCQIVLDTARAIREAKYENPRL